MYITSFIEHNHVQKQFTSSFAHERSMACLQKYRFSYATKWPGLKKYQKIFLSCLLYEYTKSFSFTQLSYKPIKLIFSWPCAVKHFIMDGEQFFGAAYRGSKQFTQQEVKTANATGFGAAADDYMERGIDLNEQLIKNKPATFFFKMKGDAMTDAGIFDGDILIVDRSLKLQNGKVVVAVLNGELLVRRFHKNFSAAYLIPDNKRYKPINVMEFNDFRIWGVVVHSIHSFEKG